MKVTLKQRQWTVFGSQRRFRVLAAGRRFGKTYLALTELCRAAWGSGRLAWYVAPTYRQAKRIWQRYEAEGDAGLVHRLRGKPGLRHKPVSLRVEVLARCAEERYADFGLT